MNAWLLKITAVVIATTCIELILPVSKIRSSCKTVLSIICLAVMIEPVAVLLKTDYSNLKGDEVDYSYVESVEAFYGSLCEQEIEKLLKERGFECVSCGVDGEFEGGTFSVKKIIVKLNESVISGKDEHIINTVEIRKYLAESLSLSSEIIEIYGK